MSSTWNWRATPDEVCFLDFETQSVCNIKKEGGARYVADPSTRIMLTGLKFQDHQTMWVMPGCTPRGIAVPEGWDLHIDSMPPDWLLEALKNGATLGAHNAVGFDEPVWSRFVKIPARWVDCVPMCRAAGLPGSLDKVCKALFGKGKDNAYALINFLCVAKPRGDTIQYPVATSAAFSAFINYCCQDVLLLAELYPRVYQFAEPELLETDRSVNQRGIPIDKGLAARLVMLREELAIKRADEFAEATQYEINPTEVRSVPKVMKWLHSLGVRLPTVERKGKMVETLDKKELTRLFKEPDAFVDDMNDELTAAIHALKIRFEVTGGGNKALAILKAADEDGRARHQTVYYGSHTGRWSGRGLQPQNLAKGLKGVDIGSMARVDLTLAEVETVANELGCSCSDVLSSLIRPTIASDSFVVGDFGSVEARGVAYLAGETEELQLFHQWGADPYLPLASQIFGRPVTKKDESERWVGKACILGCGYGMSWRKFVAYCQVQGVDLYKIGVDPEAVVKTYRKTHAKIVQGWKDLQEAMFKALDGVESMVCKCDIAKRGNDLIVRLPSGRPIVYRNIRTELQVPMYAKLMGLRPDPVPTLVFDHPHGYTGMLYGGRAMENIVQAFCRDVLADRLIETERAGLNPVFSAHDEIVCESDRLHDLTKIMCTPPRWCPDFPLLVESFQYKRYCKHHPKGVPTATGLNGEVR